MVEYLALVPALAGSGGRGDATAAMVFAIIAVPAGIALFGYLIHTGVKEQIFRRNFDLADHWRADGRLVDDFDNGALPFESFEGKAGEHRKHFHMTVDPQGDRQWVFVRYWRAGRTVDTTANALIEVPLEWPYLGVKRRRAVGRGYLSVRRREPLVELDDAEFAKRFEVRARDAAFARGFLTDDVRAGMLAQKHLMGFEIERGLFWIRFLKPLGPEGLERLAHWQLALLEHTDPSLGAPHRTVSSGGARLAVEQPDRTSTPHPLDLDLSDIE